MRRAYRSALREEQARQTRTRIVTAAATLFDQRGYSATTMASIADAAGVSGVSVQLNGPKSALLLAALQWVATGEEGFESIQEIPATGVLAAQVHSPSDLIRLAVSFAATSNQRVARLWLAMDQAANEDADVATAFEALTQRMRANAHAAVAALAAFGCLREDRSRDELADLYWALTLPDLYHRLVEQCDWNLRQYSDWLERSLTEQLLGRVS